MRLLLSALCSLLYAVTACAQTSGQNVIQKKSASAGFTYESFTLGNSQLIGRTSGGTLSGLTLGTGLSLSGTTLSSTGSGGTWGSITGTLSNQTDLQTALDAKLATATAATTYAPLASPTFTGTVTIPNGASISGYLTSATAATTYASLTGSYANPSWITSLAWSKISGISTSTGGNGAADAGKLVLFDAGGGLSADSLSVPGADTTVTLGNTGLQLADVASSGYLDLRATYIEFANSTGAHITTLLPPLSGGLTSVRMPTTTGTLVSTGDTGTVTSTMITDGTIVNADINASAAIAITKLASSTSAALGLGTIELGHATDTTLARSSAGVVTIEGATIATLSTANVFTQTQSIPGITGTGGGGLYLLINGNSTSGSMVGVSGYMPGFTTGSAGGIGFSSGAPSSGYDTFFTRDSAAVMQLGSDGASPTSYQLKSADGTGTNIAASNLTLGGSRSTGTGVGGDVIVITSMSGSSGTSANTTQERSRIIGRFVNLTESTATNFASIALASGKVVGGTATITVWASDGTDHQSLTSEIRFSAVNKAGTITATVSQTDGTTAASAGTLTVTYDATQSGSAVLLRANATSSLTQTILRSRCVITALNGDDTQTVTPQ